MESFPLIKSSLERLLHELPSPRHNSLQQELKTQLINAIHHFPAAPLSPDHPLFGKNNPADHYWPALKLACHSSNIARVREVALDSIQKLIAHNLLRGSLPLDPAQAEAIFPAASPASASTPALATPIVKRPPAGDNDLSHLAGYATPPVVGSPLPVHKKLSIVQSPTSGPPPSLQATPSPTPSSPPPAGAIPAPAPAEGSAQVLPTAAQKYQIDDIVHTVCTSFTGPQTEEPIQLQILKVLLTTVTSTTCEVHELSLLKAVQTCFNIYLYSKNQTNQITAKASLTQMLHIVFSRMENYAQVLTESAQAIPDLLVSSDHDATSAASHAATEHLSVSNDDLSASPRAEKASAPVIPELPEEQHAPATNGPEPIPMNVDGGAGLPSDEATTGLTAESPNATQPDDRQGADVAGHETQNTGSEPVVSHEAALDTGAAQAEAADSSVHPDAEPESSATPVQDSLDAKVTSDTQNPYDPTIVYYNELLRKDVFLTFRLLCRLSLAADHPSDGSHQNASIAQAAALPIDELSQQCIRARLLALELILSMITNCGPVLQSDELYVSLIRQSLCISISRNAITTNPMLFELSLSIFLLVIRFYRSQLKVEIESLLKCVYIHILEMGNSTYKQKSMVLQGLLKICESPQTLTDLYINYDCDLAMTSIFETIINACARVAQGRDVGAAEGSGSSAATSSSTTSTSRGGLIGFAASAAGLDTKADLIRAQEKRIRLRGLCCLMAVVNSLVDWCQELDPSIPLVGSGGKIRPNSASTAASVPPADSSQRLSISSNVSDANRARSGSEVSEQPSRLVAQPRPSIAVDADGSKPKTFQEALAPENQANPYIVKRHPLQTVSMAHQAATQLYANNPSVTSLTSSSNVPTGSGTLNEDGTEAPTTSLQIDSLTLRKQLMKQCITLFNQKPEKGIDMLVEHGFVERDPVSIARLLHSTSELSKSAIGDYLGEGDAFNVKTMHAFVDYLDFEDMDFVSALRQFLQSFRLPGEAQKISRYMEKFADRYCETNPQVFAKADTAYTLSYSIIMLNVDQHSEKIKVRMDKAAFIKNNRGINDGADLSDEYLSSIFDNISGNEIILEEEHAGQINAMAIGLGAGDLNDRQRMELYRKEIAIVSKKSQQALMKGLDGNKGAMRDVAPFQSATLPEVARPMFGVASWPLMATFSLLFEAANAEEEEAEFQANATPKVTDLCLQGFAGSIRIASLFKMETERDAFVTSLCKLTGLTHVVDLNSKNIKAVKTLIALANSLGEYLESSWTQILKIVSQLERLQSGSVLGHATLPTSASTGGGLMNLARKSISGESRKMDASGAPGGFNPAAEGYGLATASGKPNPALEKMIVELQQQSLIVAVDRIFSSTTKLSVTALVHFFRCLCIVSAEEVGLESTQASASSQPAMTVALVGPLRMYLLQKIVEISYYNVNRIRFEWTQIWKILQPHFNALACHSSNQVAVFAIDSLRQLNMKFLEREELGHYSTQSEFLKSFEYIVKYNPRHNIRELIVSTLSQMIHLRASSIRSGWKTIFVVFSRVAQRQAAHSEEPHQHDTSGQSISKDEERLITLSFETLQSVYLSYFDYVVLAPGAYVDYVACLAEFVLLPGVGKIHEEVVLGSTDLLQQCLERLVHLAQEGKDISPAHTHQAAASAIANKQRKSSVRSISGDYQHLVTPNASSTRTPSQPYFNANGTISEEHFFLKWFPVLTTLTRIITDSTSGQVRTKTTDILFDTLKNSGEYFEPSFWKKIHRGVLLPIFEDLRETKAQGSNGSARNSVAVVSREANYAVWIYGLRMLVDLYSIYFDALMGQQDKGVIKSTFELINSMMCRKDEKLSTTGQICLNQLLRTNIGKLPRLQQADGGRTDSWELITSCLEECFRQTTPAELLNCVYPSKSGVMVQSSQSSLDPDDSRETIDTPSHPRESIGASQNGATTIQGRTQLQSLELTQQRGNRVAIEAADVNGGIGIPLSALDFGHTIIKCSIHLELIQSIRDIALSPILNVNEDTHDNSANPDVFINLIPATFRSRWIGVMYNSYCFARTFNANVELRHALLRSGLISNLPNLTKQETISESTYIRMLFAVYRFCGDDDGEGTEILNSLVGESMDVMQRFADMVADQSKFKRDITMWSSVVIIIFQELLATKQKCHWRSSMTVDVAPGEDHMRPAESGLRLKALLPEVYRVAIECIAIDNADVRVALVEFMRGTIDLFVLH